ncbi:alcohol dehydrogenase [Spongiactinospora gelatinilytica]|uniref:Alcohol dehydrogenase n=2 Tax=Spongiactinospora gelatinilytica TaxID=2666298 RepID=A0A2W2H6G2_9ACTN|nr:alcohol dehydrogenase [Spongiactinospora gelatinilytica]
MQVRAAVVARPGGAFVIESLDMEAPRHDEVLVRITASGMCRTDLHIRDQTYPVPLPVVAGHEGVGVVEEVGSAISSFRPGQRVILSYPRCDQCAACLAARPQYCAHGFALSFGGSRRDGSTALRDPRSAGPVHGHIFQQSSFASHALTWPSNLVPVPDGVPLEAMAPLACGMQTGAGAVVNVLRPAPGSSLLIVGCGSVGFAALMIAARLGLSHLIVVDPDPGRLRLARELGATCALDPRDGAVYDQIADICPDGVSYAIDTSASPDAISGAVAALAMDGTLVLLGAPPTGTTASVDLNTILNGRTIRGVIQGDAVPQLFIPSLIELHRRGLFPMDRIVTYYDFDQINQAAADMESGSTIKPVLRMPEQHS